MAGESHLEAKIESASKALLAMEAGNRRVDRHPFASARPRFDHPTELMTWDHAVSRNGCVANPTFLEPMGIGSTQSNAENPYQHLAGPGHSHRGLGLLQPTNADESDRWCVLDGHPGVIATSLG